MNQSNLPNTNHLLNVKQAAQFLGVNVGTIRRWARSQVLIGLKIGIRGDWRFTKEELLKLTKSNHNNRLSKKSIIQSMKVKQKTKNNFYIVGIGASAGGLKAFTQLLEAIPPKIGMAFVLVQHLDPTQKSLLPKTLARTTSLPVIEVTDGTKIARNHIYTMPSESYMTIVDGTLRLTLRSKRSDSHKPIDLFFQSLAQHNGRHTIGIVLSGTGQDGTEGFLAIKTNGGITFAQDDSAQYKGMPQSAINTGSVDFILPPGAMSQTLLQISRNINSDPDTLHSSLLEARGINTVLTLLKAKTGMDFRQYKSTTVNRRIHRQMLLYGVESINDYATFLSKNPQEIEVLQKSMLIHVTSFFREPDQFEALKRLVFPALLKSRSSKEPIKIWVPGCATGEEAYSLAIILQEFLGKKAASLSIHIFATDIGEQVIAEATKGVYKENITENVSQERIAKFFIKVNGGYKVKDAIRDICEFAVADVTQKPLQLNFDLISCRNVLIYFSPALQQKALFTLSSGLKPGGFLLLGESDGLGASAKLFSPVDSKQRVYSTKAINPATADLKKTINAQVGMDTSLPFSKELPISLSGNFDQITRQQKIIKLKEAVVLTQEYTNEITSELDVMNVEMQSANEELETTKEELQTTNEEMTTLNEELQIRNKEVVIALDYAEGIIKTVREPLVILDGRFRVKSANESFYKIFKVTPQQTENMPLFELGNKQWEIPKLRRLLEEILPKNFTVIDYEVEHDFESIGQKTMLLNARTLQQGPNKIPLILLAIEDITDRKKAEKALKQSEGLFRTANEKMTALSEELQIRNEEVTIARDYADAIIRTVRGPLLVLSKDLRIISANESFYKAFKVAPNDTENRLLYDLGNRQWNIPKLKTLLEKILPKNNTLTDYEVVHDFKDIGQKTMLLNARTLQQGSDKTSLILLAIEDITDRKDIEIQKDLFIGIASHELKTPITTMKGYAQILEKRLGQSGDSKDTYLIQNINKQTDRLTNLINDLLDTSKIQAGKLILEKKSFDLNAVVAKAVVDFQYATETHQIIREGEIKEEVYADQGRIEQVLANLITNAIKYSPKADKVIVRVGTDKKNAMVNVQDFGFGITKRDQAKVFERFYRTGDKEEMNVVGFGLGLYIAAEIIKSHHGKIWIESTKGKGSTFYFTLPLKK